MSFLPVTMEEVKKRGWNQLDFVLISGDAYVDHPSFGHAIITRVLEAEGYKVGIIAQPDWKNTEAFKKLGKPRLGFLIASGNVDSMVNHYSVFKRRRKTDYYSPGGKAGLRPDRAAIVYANKAREAYKDVPVILGGIEASLRRLGHYDYWDNQIRRSVLLDSKADMILYGMGEKTIIQLAEALHSGIAIKDITWIKGTVYKKKDLQDIGDYILLPSFQEINDSKKSYGESFLIQYNNMNHYTGKILVEDYGHNTFVIQNPPQELLNEEEMDRVYALPYTYEVHPSYEGLGGVPAIDEVQYSITSNRGCFGRCSFCALTFHQGDVVQVRSKESIVSEGKDIVTRKGFKGYIHDVGGPTANFRHPACKKQWDKGSCQDKSCLFPKPCKNLKIDHKDYLNILRELRNLKGVKKVFVRSGIRYDYAIHDKDHTFIRELCEHHVSGHLKIAPEHISDKVLFRMGKPSRDVYEKFTQKFDEINKKIGKKQYIIPYFISSHPGAEIEDAIEMALYLKKTGFIPEQVQDFYPTPGTMSTCMYYTGMDPRTMEKVYIPKSVEEKNMQRALLQFNRPENYQTVKKALIKAGRKDLIGYGKDCLIPPENRRKNEHTERNSGDIKNKQRRL